MAQELLIIFTRYPEQGVTKTRLIPALGAKGAAELQRQMTEHTLSQSRKLQSQRSLSLEVRFAGGNLTLMQDWLGAGINYQPQGAGDLGARMTRSLSAAFHSRVNCAVIIGSDCPGLNADLIERAFQQLYIHDLVLGPAIDGGYYLIGLRCLVPELFNQINWGTDEVLKQTTDVANQLNLSIFYLPQLADVDRPEDLPVWEQIIQAQLKSDS